MRSRCAYGGLSPLLMVGLLFSWVAAEAGESLAERPIGYLQISDVVDGKINVEARCVPTKDLLEAIAQRAGVPVVFDEPCNTYVSVCRPNKQ